jgi:hypothetical protein
MAAQTGPAKMSQPNRTGCMIPMIYPFIPWKVADPPPKRKPEYSSISESTIQEPGYGFVP